MKTDTSLENNPFVADILAQPAALRRALETIQLAPLFSVVKALHNGAIERIVLTGMGSSLYALYPAWLRLANAGLPAVWVDAAELLHTAPGLLTPRTLLWVASQSGWSAEIVALLDRARRLAAKGRPVTGLLAIVNDLESPLAHAALPSSPSRSITGELGGLLLALNCGPEGPLTAHTFLNTLAVAGLAAQVLCSPGESDLELAFCQIEQAAANLEAYLADWPTHLGQIGASLGVPKKIVLLGRGASLAVVYNAAMAIHEAARLPALPMQAAEFRHGPIEMAGADLTAVILAGEGAGREMNYRLCSELRQKGANALWLDPASAGEETAAGPGTLPAPAASGLALLLAEAVPLQLACIHLARQAGLTPGKFRYIGKVTAQE